jgi:hypothetical protein
MFFDTVLQQKIHEWYFPAQNVHVPLKFDIFEIN